MSQTIGNQAFSPKDPAEIVLLAFDFTALVGGTTMSMPVVSVTVSNGDDASPSSLLSGQASISGAKVLQRVQGGLDQVTYRVKAQVDASDGSRYVLAGLLPVRAV